jgi:hypothetical protein
VSQGMKEFQSNDCLIGMFGINFSENDFVIKSTTTLINNIKEKSDLEVLFQDVRPIPLTFSFQNTLY